MTQNVKTQMIFLQNHKQRETKMFAFCVKSYEPVKHLRNICPNLSFVKDENTVGQKKARNGHKTAN